ncbi:FAD-binding domain-containing protein [Aquariibacter albus]|uniref:Deoxyribodipyrimidine photolyase n=1 Tax=Aquariibacter albus TaxID=2759899 RepID=A0A839HGR1_9BURK|nr:FAD-binding domain-containing protein [Aquariibacter albus]MBB1160396.1 deoxyribodipyrimidine photolyase [Aquariibacter albus]
MSLAPAPIASSPASDAPAAWAPGPADLAALQAAGIPAALHLFPPSAQAAWARLAALKPASYARSRNALDGAVSGLSPYFAHGLIEPGAALAALAARHRLGYEDKLVFEFGWRAFFHHVRARRGDAILDTLRPEGLPAGPAAYRARLPEDVLEARSGVPAIDQAVRVLYASGYLHNHARMWLASYLVHLRKVDWRVAADWLYGHLLDGDLACNHLSWQWVAGSFSSKPYLFNADNVARYAPAAAARAWRSAGTLIDRSYEALEQLARQGRASGPEPGAHPAVEPPALRAEPSAEILAGLRRLDDLAELGPATAALDLVHPWALGEPPVGDRPQRLGLLHLPAHAARPWSARRWAWVLARMAAVCDRVWIGDAAPLLQSLRAQGRPLRAAPAPESGYARLLAGLAAPSAPPPLFADPAGSCTSFSRWYAQSQALAPHLEDRLRPWAAAGAAGLGTLSLFPG